MSIYAIGDLHLSFDNRINKSMDIFGKEWFNHYERVEDDWRKKVEDDDLVILCGDISWGLRFEEAEADFRWIDGLPGKKVITKGNHDLWWCSISKMNAKFDTISFLQNKSYTVYCGNERIAVAGTRGWICPGTEGFDSHDEKIYKRELIRLEMALEDAKNTEADNIIGVLHYPPTNGKSPGSGFTSLMQEYGVKTCVYGHLHGKEAFKKGFQGILNGVDYRLVSLDYTEGRLKKIY